jgi:hypothetical protein
MEKYQKMLDIQAKQYALIEEARVCGFVLTVEQVALEPLAMGNYDTRVTVRETRQ